MMKYLLQLWVFLLFFGGVRSQNLIQGTLKVGGDGSTIEVWLKPNFSNTTEYLFQIGMPIAFPASASVTGLNVTLDPGFVSAFGNNYSKTVNPVATATGGTEKYFNIVLVRSGAGASNAQTWTAGAEFKVLTFTFSPSAAPASPVKLADYQDGGSDALGNFYTQSGNNDYYITTNSVGNFYATPGQSNVGGTSGAGYAQTLATIPMICTAPSIPIVTNITTTTADINWVAVSGAAGYEYAVTNSAVPPTSGTATTGTTYSASGLTASTQYYIHVRTNCGTGSYSSWATASFNTQNLSCTSPSGLAANNITTASADINWNTVIGAVGYEYAVTTSATPPASGTAITGTSYNATGLTSGTTYYAHVRSDCGSGFFSSWVNIAFNTNCPTTSIPVVSNITAAGADINWTPVGGGASGYEYAISTSSTAPVSGTIITGTSYSATGLLGGTVYYIYVRTLCNAGNFSAWNSAMFQTSCPSISTPSISTVTTNSVDINWIAVSGAIGYEYELSTDAVPPASGTATTATTFSGTNLLPGTLYYFHIRTACAGGGFSSWVTVSFVTQGLSCPPASTPVISNITATGAGINWTLANGSVGSQYAITTSAIPPASGTATTNTSYTATGLNGGTLYYAHVRANCGGGNFSAWSTVSFTTLCGAPAIAPVTNITATSATISWGTAGGAVGYEYVISTSATAPISGKATMATSLDTTGLIGGTQYYVYVRTNCGAGKFSAWANKIFITPCFATVITATVNEKSAVISWNSVSGVESYEYSFTMYPTPPLSGASTTDTSYQLDNLSAGVAYYFHVRTHCASGGLSEWVTYSFHTPGLDAYPNPVSNSLRITLYGESNGNGQVSLYDAAGKLVRRVSMIGNTVTIDMRGVAAGVYLIRYVDGEYRYMGKVLKL